jgi:hypothetical protein
VCECVCVCVCVCLCAGNHRHAKRKLKVPESKWRSGLLLQTSVGKSTHVKAACSLMMHPCSGCRAHLPRQLELIKLAVKTFHTRLV